MCIRDRNKEALKFFATYVESASYPMLADKELDVYKRQIQMNPEKWFIRHRLQLTIKRFVVLIRKFTWFACPQRSSIIDVYKRQL